MIPDVFSEKKEKNIQGCCRKLSYIENYIEILFEIMRMRPNKNYQKKKNNFGSSLRIRIKAEKWQVIGLN